MGDGMGDFDQTEAITTLRKYNGDLKDLEQELCHYSKNSNIALVLPAAYREFDGSCDEKPVYKIIDTLGDVPPYIHEIVMPVGQADESQFRKAKEAMSSLKTPERSVDLIWINSPRIQSILNKISKEVRSVGSGKKGQGQWLSDGYVIAKGESDSIVHHDCDIYTYDREMIANLVHPVLCPDMNFEYGTGYYPRIGRDGKMKGRLTRLLAKPLFVALKIKSRQYSPNDEAFNFLNFLLEHKYIFSGEGFKSVDFAKTQRITDDYDIEIVEKREAFDKLRKKVICQKEIADTFEHFHQPLSTDDGKGGLEAMSKKVVTALYEGLMSYGMDLTNDNLRVIEKMYSGFGQDFIKKYWADSISRGLGYDRPGEESNIEFFYKCLKSVRKDMFDGDGSEDMVVTIPNWERVHSAIPGVYDELIGAVHADNK